MSRLTPITTAVAVPDGVAFYLDRLRRRGRSANTVRAYGTDLRQFAEYLEARGEGTLVALVTTRHISGWLDTLDAANVSRRSQSRKLTVVRGFFHHAKREGWIGHDPTVGERVSFRAVRVQAPELDALMRMIETIDPGSRHGRRDRALLRLTLDSGLRIAEVIALDVPGVGSYCTVDLERRLVHARVKGGGMHTVPVNDRTIAMLRDWLHVRQYAAQAGEPALFVSNRGGRFSRMGVHALCARRGAAAGLKGLHLHLLRHRRIADVYERCGKEVAQRIAGHVSGSTTEQVYGAHADGPTLRLARERADLDDLAQGRAA